MYYSENVIFFISIWKCIFVNCLTLKTRCLHFLRLYTREYVTRTWPWKTLCTFCFINNKLRNTSTRIFYWVQRPIASARILFYILFNNYKFRSCEVTVSGLCLDGVDRQVKCPSKFTSTKATDQNTLNWNNFYYYEPVISRVNRFLCLYPYCYVYEDLPSFLTMPLNRLWLMKNAPSQSPLGKLASLGRTNGSKKY